MTDYLRLMQDEPPATDAPAANPYLDAMQAESAPARAGASSALDTNPDEAAKHKRIAGTLQVPVAAVEADPAKAQREMSYRELQTAIDGSPAMQKKFADPNFAKLAHDDSANLSGFDQLLRSFKRGWTAGLRGWDAREIDTEAQTINTLDRGQPQNEPLRPRQAMRMAQPGLVSDMRANAARRLGEEAVDFTQRSEALNALQVGGATKGFYEAEGWGASFKALLSDPVEITGNVVAESLGIMAPGTPAIVAGGMTAGPVGMAAAVGGTSYNAEYGTAIAEELQKSGIDLNDTEAVKAFVATPEFAEVRRKASVKAAVIGAFDAATAGLAGVKLRPSALGNLGAQTGVQMAGGGAGEALGSVAIGEEIHPSSVIAEMIGEIPGAVTDVATMSARSAMLNRAKAADAEESAAQIEQINQLAAASKVLQRDPESFQQFVAAAAEDGPVSHVYVDAKSLMQSGVGEQLFQDSPAVREQFDQAILTGGAIAIPVDEYAARVAPKEYAGQLLDHLRTDPEGFTRFEAQAYMTEAANDLQAEVERNITEVQGRDEFRASQDRVKQTVLDNLNQVGRFSPEKNELDATLIAARSAVRAAQLGMTPEAFFEKQVLRVQGEKVGGMAFDQKPDRTFRLADLPRDMREELFNEHATNLNPEAIERKFYAKNVPSGLIDIRDIKVDEIPADQLQRYKDAKLADLPPIVIADGRLIDGQHRIQAAREKGIRQLRYIDMTGLIDTEAGGYVSDLPADTLNQSALTNPIPEPDELDRLRARVAELEKELRTSPITGLKNQRAFDEDEALGWPAVAAADLDGLKRLNTAVGHAGADNVLRTLGGLLLKAEAENDGVRAYHRSGDEFAFRFKDADSADLFMADLQERLDQVEVEIEVATDAGTEHYVYQGIGISYGVADSYEKADHNAEQQKRERLASGQREDARADESRPPRRLKRIAEGQDSLGDAAQSGSGVAGAGYVQAVQAPGRSITGEPAAAGWQNQTRIRNASGPITVYRGASELLTADHFKPEALGKASGHPSSGVGVWFTTRRDEAETYGDVESMRLDIRNPLTIGIDQIPAFDSVEEATAWRESLRAEGYDGIILDGRNVGKPEDHIVAFEPEQAVLPEQEFYQSGKPSFRKPSTPEFREWYGRSKVKGVVYHATAADFDAFDTTKGDLGAHFGSIEQANYLKNRLSGRGSMNIMPVWLSIRNPLRLKDVGSFHADGIAVQLEKKGLLKKGEGKRIEKEIDADWTLRKKYDPMLRQIIKDAGYDGVVYKNEHEGDGDSYIAFEPEQIKSAVGNRGTFDPNNPDILMQPDGGAPASPRGAFNPSENVITLLKGADLSTFLHESAHYFFENDIVLAGELASRGELSFGEQQIVDDVSALLRWHGIQGGIHEQLRQWHTMDFEEKRAYHERTAESFEAYLIEGRAPSLELARVFQTFRAWMLNVYKSLKSFVERNPEAGKLNDEVRGVFDRMLATTEQIRIAEQGRSLMNLFTAPEQTGMTPDEFAAYQAQGTDASNAAIQELQAKGLRDMKWLAGKRGREIAKLQREAKALRAEAQIEARRAVMSQPVYQAWDFLTRKLSANDKLPALERKSDPNVVEPEIDSLFVAIAKLGGVKKDQVLSEWGVDAKDIPQSGLFGKPVWRVTDGLTLDGMAEALAQHGYLPLNEHGQYELNDFYDRFAAELSGEPQYSDAHQYNGDTRPGEQIANPGGLMAGRIDLGALVVMGFEQTQIDLLKARRMVTTKGGMHPDVVAEVFAFGSGDELVRKLVDATPPKEAIEQATDKLMVERHADLATPEAIAEAADMAIHNDVRAKFVTSEYNALAKALGKKKILADAAKAFAADMIARLKVRDIRPGLYANAEAKAAKAAEKALKAGDTQQAAAEKKNQAINVYAARAAYEAKDSVASGIRYLKKFDSAGVRKKLDVDYLDQIDAMLERFDLRAQSLKAIDKRKSLAAWLQSQREAGVEPELDPALENEANRKSYKDMTVEEFRGLVDAVKQIDHLGRLKKKLLTVQDQREFAAIVAEAAGSIVEHGGEARPVELEAPTGIKPWLEGFAAGHRKLASLFRQMDGGVDGGAMWRIIGRGMNEAATSEAVMIEQATMKLAELYAPLLKLKGGLNGDKQFIPEINASLTRAGRLSIALNWGNETNRARIMEGDGWSERQVQAVFDRITREEWQFVQNVWAYIDSYWPQIADKERRVTGRAPDKVDAAPFRVTLPDGETMQLDGGYYPIKYDSNRSDRAEKHEAAAIADDMKRGAFTRATTRRGHTKARVESVGRPVKKTLDVITQHVSEVTHDLAWHEWLIDANRVIDANDVNTAIRDHYGPEVIRTIKDGLAGIATADIVPQTKIDTALLYLRANVSRSTMGISLTTAFLQPFGLAQSMVRIGAKPVLRGMARWAGDAARFESSMNWIGEKSDFMRLRNKTFNRELHEIKGRVSQGRSKARQIYDASLFILMQKMQLVADVPTWIGAYEKALAEGQDDATAIAFADQAVLDSQGGGQTKDMAEFQRKSPFLTMFYSYFNTTLNLAAESTAKTDFKNPLALAGWAADMALLMVIPALGPGILMALMRGEECEGEECAKKLAEMQAGYLLGTVIGLRELSGPVSGYDYAGPPVGRVVNELSRVGTQVAQGEADEGLAMSSISLLGVSLGIPTTQILRSWRGWKAWDEGEAPAASILLGPPPKD